MLDKISSFKFFIICFAILALYIFFVMSPDSQIGAQLRSHLPADVTILDMKQSYSPVDAYAVLDKMGDGGRQDYLRNLLTIDLIFPLLYSLTMASLIMFLLSKIQLGNSLWKLLGWLPFLGAAFDLLENCSVAALIINYPQRIDLLARAASFFTTAKWQTINLIMLIMLGEVIVLISLGLKRIFTERE